MSTRYTRDRFAGTSREQRPRELHESAAEKVHTPPGSVDADLMMPANASPEGRRRRYRVTISAYTRSRFCREIEADSQDEAEMLAEWIETEGQFEEDIDYWDEQDPVVEEISEGAGTPDMVTVRRVNTR